jgi:hypothetical protein
LFNDSTFLHRFAMPLPAQFNWARAVTRRTIPPGLSASEPNEIFSDYYYSFDHGLFHFISLDTESQFDSALITKYAN